MISTYTSKLKQLQIGDLIAKIPIIQGGMGVGISRSHLAGHAKDFPVLQSPETAIRTQ